MMWWIVIVHAILAVTAYFACAMFFAADRSQREYMRGQGANRDFVDSRFAPTVWLFFGLPAILCGWYLHSKGYDISAILTFCVAGGLGLLKARVVMKR